ncbi:hypothetical protein [Clostridium sp. HBUAS56010]|uniref:hypothetical protein n=1 Tax=Clostridium sp. HBUAS56010 TaxID=2571127 RepID=UPI0011786103|nr:hypothetical protein [Clostridium sp. HBUAS56010]
MIKSKRFKNNSEITAYNNDRIIKFRDMNKSNTVEIPMEKIKLLYQVHIDGLKRHDISKTNAYYRINNVPVTGTIIVHPDVEDPGNFNLLTGWHYYVIADSIGQETINAIMINCDRKSFKKMIGCVRPYNYVKTDDLKVPEIYARSTVSEQKLNSIKEYAERYHQPIKPIIVDVDNSILDGYAQYIYNKETNVRMSQVLRSQKKLESFVGK